MISNNSQLAAKYLPNEVDQSIKTLKTNINNVFFQGLIQKEKKIFLQKIKMILGRKCSYLRNIIEGWENHPEGENLSWLHMIP